MTLEQYNRILHAINAQIDELQQSRQALIPQNQKQIEKQIAKRQAADRKWFIANFDVFWNNRDKFSAGTPNADTVIDFFNLYTRGSKCGRKFIRYITVGDLISLWNAGFKYCGYPIVEYTNHTFSHRLTYIKDDKSVTVSGLSQENLGFSPFLCGSLEYLCAHKSIANGFEEYKTIKTIKEILAN